MSRDPRYQKLLNSKRWKMIRADYLRQHPLCERCRREGIAAGVGFGSGDTGQAFLIAGGIALQNIPEGMVIIGPMLAAGVSKKRTFVCALATGLVEVVGTLIGYFAVSISTVILPFALAFAGGTMLYVISDEMIPETHAHGSERGATYALLIGFAVMLAFDFFLG